MVIADVNNIAHAGGPSAAGDADQEAKSPVAGKCLHCSISSELMTIYL